MQCGDAEEALGELVRVCAGGGGDERVAGEVRVGAGTVVFQRVVKV